MLKNSIYFIVGLFFFLGCHQDFESGEKITSTQFLPEIKSLVQGSILGYVYNEENQPVEGALVEIYGAQTTTDKFGVFHFENKNLDALGTYIRIMKSGYMIGSDKIYPAGGRAYSKTKLFSLRTFEQLEAKSGGEIMMKRGGSLVFEPESVVDANGNIFEGTVQVTGIFLSPQSPALSDEMPGELVGGNLSGIYAALGTAGMFGVEMRSELGEKLQVRQGKKVRFKIPAESNQKPATIPMWHFDENRGYWIEEGTATLVNGFYVGEVSHFSFWNCDAPFPLIKLSGSVESENGKPLAGISILIEAEGLNGRNGYIDAEGRFCGLVPKNKRLTLIFKRIGCDDVIKEVVVGPFSDNTEIDKIILENPSLSIGGSVLCESSPVPDAIVVIQYKDVFYHTLTDDNGNYFYQFYPCQQENGIRIFAYDPVTFKASSPEEVQVTNGLLHDISICSANCQIDGSIKDKCDYLEMVLANGSGSVYEFLWSTGDSSSIATNLPLTPKTICVTVEDPNIPNCNQTFCFDYRGKLTLFIESECWNPMTIYPSGGVQPYSYLWHNGSTTKEVFLTGTQNYCVTVTDAVGCTAVKCGVFEEAILDNQISGCSKDKFNIFSSPFTIGSITRNNQNITVTSLDNLSVFVTGFNFSVYISQGQCTNAEQYKLPQFKGLVIDSISHTSCVGCTDGAIRFTLDGSADCLSCTVGGTRIFNVLDTNTDLSTLNVMGLLSEGDYYVVVEDANSGCYIAFEKVKVE